MDSFSEAFLFAGIMALFLSLILFVPLWAPRVVFGSRGFRSSDGDVAPIPSFFLSDGLVLTGYLAIANALAAATREPRNDYSMQLAIFANLLVVASWLMCQRFMRSRDIRRQRSRILLQTVLYPLSILAVAQIIASAFMLTSGIELLTRGIDVYFSEPMIIAAATLLVIAIIAVCAIRYCYRRFFLDSDASPSLPVVVE
jgi:hypothetical protein